MMLISENKVVSIDYTLKNDKGEVLDTSSGRSPLSYIQGKGHIIPGLEKACEGKTTGDSFNVSIEPKEAYGEYSEEMVITLPKSKFDNQTDIKVGMQFQAQTEMGVQVFSVLAVEENDVKLDGNHPLAGATLHFDVKVTDVREATAEELSHGHVH
jgi:FKBP-type peptidyl-prolyl cis-trans isomerase SlyD